MTTNLVKSLNKELENKIQQEIASMVEAQIVNTNGPITEEIIKGQRID